MKAKFIYESIEDYLEPKNNEEIINSISSLPKRELDTKLILAANKGLTTIVKYLIKAGADINAKDGNGYNVLHRASINKHEQIVKILLDAGADVNIKTTDGWTPLHLASSRGYEQIVKMLIKAGADLNVKADDGWTPLHVAIRTRYKNIIDLLKSCGAKE